MTPLKPVIRWPRLPMVRSLAAWLLYQTALTRTTPEGRPASVTYVTEEKS